MTRAERRKLESRARQWQRAAYDLHKISTAHVFGDDMNWRDVTFATTLQDQSARCYQHARMYVLEILWSV